MRSYEEQEKRAYEKAEQLIEKKRRKAVFIRRCAAIGLGAAAVLAVGIFTNVMKPPTPPVEFSGLVSESDDTTTSAVTVPSQESSGSGTSECKTEKTTTATETAGTKKDTNTETKTTAATGESKSSETRKTTTVKTTKKSSKTTAKTSAVSTDNAKHSTSRNSRTTATTTKKTTRSTTKTSSMTSTTTIRTTTRTQTTFSTQSATYTATWQINTQTYSASTSTTATDSLGNEQYNNVTWTVTPIRDTIKDVGGRFIGAYPKEAAKYTNLVRGTITDITEYTVSWNDSMGQNRSTRVSVLDVRVDEVYYGSVSKRNLKIYYHASVTNRYQDTFLLRKGNEYFFLVREFGGEIAYGYLNTAFHPENYADAYINMTNKAVFPVIEGNVTFYDQFITKASDDIDKPKTIPVNEVSDKIPDEVSGEDWFCCLDEDEFVDYFTRMFDYYNQ